MLEPRLRFLIVEDQGELRRTIVAMLKQSGVKTVHDCSSIEEAAEILQNFPVDFILCDWNSDRVDAMKLLRSVRANSATATIPFLMVSGPLPDETLSEAAELNVDGHLIKPLTQKIIEEKIRDILNYRTTHLETDVRLARANAFVDIKAYDDALEELSKAEENNPESARLMIGKGELYEAMGDLENAKSCYESAMKFDETNPKAYDCLGSILEKEGKTDEAIEMVQYAVSLSPRNKDRQMRFAKALMAKGDLDAARTALHNAVEDSSDEGARSATVAEFFLANGRADLAETEYAFALEADPENVHYYNRLGIAFRRQKKYKEAVENYRKALVVAQDDEVIYFNMARALHDKGDTDQAIAALRRALVLNPNFSEAEELLKHLQNGQQK